MDYKRKNNCFIKSTVCVSKNSKFIREQQAKGLLGNLLGTKITILDDIPLVNTLF